MSSAERCLRGRLEIISSGARLGPSWLACAWFMSAVIKLSSPRSCRTFAISHQHAQIEAMGHEH